MSKMIAFTDHSNISLTTYLRDIRKYKCIDEEKEQELATRIAMGDSRARNELVYANLRLVVLFAKRYQGFKLEIMDLIGAGNEGLIHAAGRFEANRKARFSTFASYYIRKEILLALFNPYSHKEDMPEESCINPYINKAKEAISLEDYAIAEHYWEADYDSAYSSSYDELRRTVYRGFSRRDADMLLDFMDRDSNCSTITFLAHKYHMQDRQCQKLIDEMINKLHRLCKQDDTYADVIAA